jgi:YggT family protein
VIVDILQMLLATATGLLGTALILRLYLRWLGVAPNNPLSQFCLVLTNWLAHPFGAARPRAGRLDSAVVVALVAVAVTNVLGLWWLNHLRLARPSVVAVAVAVTMLRWTLQLGFWLVVLNLLMSMINPYAPLAPLVERLTRPLLAPLRRLGLRAGGFDLAPMLAMALIGVAMLVTDRLPV